jgi:hypothetical protein
MSGYEVSISRHIKKQKTQFQVAHDAWEPHIALSQGNFFQNSD